MSGNDEPILCPSKTKSDDEHGKEEGYDYHRENLEIFKETVVPWMKSLEMFVKTSQHEDARSKLHAIRSLCNSVGAKRLGRKVGEIEDELISRKRDLKECFPPQLVSIFDETIEHITEVIDIRGVKKGP